MQFRGLWKGWLQGVGWWLGSRKISQDGRPLQGNFVSEGVAGGAGTITGQTEVRLQGQQGTVCPSHLRKYLLPCHQLPMLAGVALDRTGLSPRDSALQVLLVV